MTLKELEKLGDQFSRVSFYGYGSNQIFSNPESHLKRSQYYYEQALELDKDNVRLLSKLANQYYPDHFAFSCIERAIELESNNILLQTQKAYFLLQNEKIDEALEIVDVVLAKTPNDQHALTLKARILKEQADLLLDRLDDSLTERENPSLNSKQLMFAASENFHALKNPCAALKYLDAAIKLEPDNKLLWTHKYWYLHKQHQFHEAETLPPEKLSFQHTIDLKTFFQTGHFGPIVVGMTKQQVIEHFGQPEDIYPLNDGQSKMEREDLSCMLHNAANPLWLYGIFEFWFNEETDILYRISLVSLKSWSRSWSYVLRLDPWIYRGVHDDLLLSDLLKAFDLEGISYQDYGFGQPYPNIKEVGQLILSSGVEILYEIKNDLNVTGLVHVKNDQLGM